MRVSATAVATETQSKTVVWIIASLTMVLMLLAPALWNRFPLIFPDVGGYLLRPMTGTLEMGRSALYGLFLYAGIPFSFWLNVILQAALTVWLIVLTLRTHGLNGRPWLATGIVAMLTVGTSLPWFTGQLMPDILFPAAVLALHMLVFRSEQLARSERFALAAVIAFAIPSHMAAAGMAVGIIVALWLIARVTKFALPKARIALAAGAVVTGVALCPVSNYAITGNFAFTPGGSSFVFGRLVEDGIIARYLSERCPDPALQLCGYYRDMPRDADEWLWGSDTPFHKLGGWTGYVEEQNYIIGETLKRYPVMHATTAIADTFIQFFKFKTEISVWDNAPTIGMIKDHLPQIFPSLMAARQQTENFSMAPFNLIHVPVAALAIAGIGLALLWRRRFDIAPETAALCITILLALAANAAICGIFAHPVDRYQSRLVLLAPLALALLAARRYRA